MDEGEARHPIRRERSVKQLVAVAAAKTLYDSKKKERKIPGTRRSTIGVIVRALDGLGYYLADPGSIVIKEIVRRGDLPMLKRAVRNKRIEVNELMVNGLPPLAVVLSWSRDNCMALQMVKFLLESGADPNLEGDRGVCILPMAASYYPREVLQMLIDYGGRVGPAEKYSAALHCAAREGRLDNAALLLGHGANINARDINGYTPLMEAVRLNRMEMVNYLLRMGADAEATITNYEGKIWSAYMIALGMGHGEMEAVLEPFEKSRLAKEAEGAAKKGAEDTAAKANAGSATTGADAVPSRCRSRQ